LNIFVCSAVLFCVKNFEADKLYCFCIFIGYDAGLMWYPGKTRVLEQKNSTSPFLPWMSWKATKALTALTPEIDYDQTTMGLPFVTSAVFLITKS
jgi:hypothetical protein